MERFYIKELGVHNEASNFFVSPFVVPHFRDRLKNGEPGIAPVAFATVEHYYQAAKTLDWQEAEKVRLSRTPGESKRAGRSVSLAPTWEADKFLAMRWALEYKFAPGTGLADWLVSTGKQILIEGNDWHDTFWGVDSGVGHNWLGFMLMARRAELQAI